MRRDCLLCLVVVLLCIVGVAAVYSVDPLREEGLVAQSPFGRQLLWNFVGWGVFALFRFVDFQWFLKRSWIWYLISVLALGGVLLFGESDETGAKRWLFSRSVQPSELSKFALLLFLSWYLSVNRDTLGLWNLLIKSAFLVAVPAFLIFLEPDLGTALVFGVLWFGALLVGGWRAKQLGILSGILLGLLFPSWFFLRDYQRKRILAFFDPWQDPLGSGYNVVQSQIAIGAGGVFGQGWLSGKQAQLRFLPARHTDFIFASWCEQLGFIGGVILILLFGILFWIILDTAIRTRELEKKFFASLFGLMLLFQVSVNIGMNLGIAPVTGIPLPFVSYGGSSLFVYLACAGVVARIAWEAEEGEKQRWT
ncbi:MAG: FtsW/RodA/SpoVE family cell cycle protein [Atribacterota bacterium]